MRKRKQISILVPLGGHERMRSESWHWLREYYRHFMPTAEIVIGHDKASQHRWYRRHPKSFSKAVAINHAFKKSHGDIIVLLDSDAYIDTKILQHCAARLRSQRKVGVHSWFVPYDHLYRLTEDASKKILESDPRDPLRLPTPPPKDDIEGGEGSGPLNVFGAMCQAMPREAFITVGGMDPRFRGWGAEDAAFAQALDTLWGPRKNTPNDILHLHHPMVTKGTGPAWTIKMWDNQSDPGINNFLAGRYQRAYNKPDIMRALVNEGRRAKA